jgi:hypothetical protein
MKMNKHKLLKGVWANLDKAPHNEIFSTFTGRLSKTALAENLNQYATELSKLPKIIADTITAIAKSRQDADHSLLLSDIGMRLIQIAKELDISEKSKCVDWQLDKALDYGAEGVKKLVSYFNGKVYIPEQYKNDHIGLANYVKRVTSK